MILNNKMISGPGKLLLGLLGPFLVTGAYADTTGEWSGNISLDTRLFANDAIHAGQDDQNISIAFEPQYYADWDDGDQRFVFNPFFRLDANDDERTHADLRELYWRGTYGDVEVKIGAVKVFWGVTESQHLVDIINQTDLVENIDTEDKLGQPMVNLTWLRDWGTLNFFVMPYFRERTFPGTDGRLRTALVVDTDNETYESGAEERHVDVAVRWSHFIGDWDIGIAHFSGTGREPKLVPTMIKGRLVLVPHYQQIDQTSLDLQATKGNWLWKLELISRNDDDGRFTAFVGGFEYTLVGIRGSATDLGLLLEYHFDDRDNRSTTGLENDVFAGTRWVLNDIQSTELLAGVIVDADTQATTGSIEASRRLGQSWKATLEARFFTNLEPTELLYDFRDDDYIELQIAKYF